MRKSVSESDKSPNGRIMGYADPWSVAPGDTVRFMISGQDGSRYRLQLFRLLQPDAGPKATPFVPEPVAAPCNGEHLSRFQPMRCGSSASAPFPKTDVKSGITLSACISSYLPGRGRQALLGIVDQKGNIQCGLEIDPSGSLTFRYTERNGEESCLSLPTAMRRRAEYLVVASLDPESGVARLAQIPIFDRRMEIEVPACTQCPAAGLPILEDGAVAFAAWPENLAGPQMGAFHFNGRIAAPMIVAGAHSADRVERWMRGSEGAGNATIGAWDFARETNGDQLIDRSEKQLHAVLHNRPLRTSMPAAARLTGRASDDYLAIHFHEDDIEDARWDVEAEFTVPDELKSGIYAAHLKSDGMEFWIPFFIRPGPECALADVALLVPTVTYIAYLNHRGRLKSLASENVYGKLNVVDPLELIGLEFPEAGISTYDRHLDGTGACHSSRLRPAFNMQPDSRLWNFTIDLLIIDWLEQVGIPYHVLTDEDVHRDGAEALKPYPVVLTGSHPEYATETMLDALEAHLGRGGRMMYLGGNGFYWRTAMHPTRTGIIEVRRDQGVRSWEVPAGEERLSFTCTRGGLWRSSGRAPQLLTGVGYTAQGFDKSEPYYIQVALDNERVHWAFDGISSYVIGDEGLIGGGAAGLELDACDFELGTPSHTLVLAHSRDHSNAFQLANECVQVPSGANSALLSPLIRSDMTFFETPAGGAVFSAGSIAYAGALSANRFDNDLCRLTTNVLRRFVDPTPFIPPSDGDSSPELR